MLCPQYVDLAAAFFYPLGNTPAACLTQHLEPARPARVLCLGCGDARNVLFTAYCEAARADDADARPIDITSCDLQRAVIARNILLFSLILDGCDPHALWCLYYHQFLDARCLALLRRHATALTETSASLADWRHGPYGRCLRVGDAATLAAVREVWLSYVNADARPSCAAEFARAKQAQEASGRAASVITAARSAAPSTVDAMLDAPRLFAQYWRSGTTDGPGATAKADLPNPMFSGQMDSLTLHYGTDPLLGFHLATAYLPLTNASPLNPNQLRDLGLLDLDPLVKTARLQFEAWCDAFRTRSRQFTLRFVVAEAMAFCHVLLQRLTAADDSVRWYRGPYMPDPLILDADDYSSGQAPLAFDVIDTSNLIDHLGALNLLVATAPLLDGSLASNLVTESLVRRHEADQPAMEALLCGNATALSPLLGLFPVQYWTNASPVSSHYEAMLQAFSGNVEGSTQLHSRLTWKSRSPDDATEPSRLHYDEADLAQLLYQTYLTMFEAEDPVVLMAKSSAQHIANISMPYYTRASFAAFLRYVKSKVEADWNKAAKILLELIDKDTRLMLGRNFLQELRVQMHLFDVCSDLMSEHSWGPGTVPQLAWNALPNVLNVTLKVPRSKLRVFHEVETRRLGTPPLICHAYTPTERSSFASIQLAFGTESCTGERNTEHFALSIQQDGRRWNGESPLWVSFLVPTAVLLNNPRHLSFQLTLQVTPFTVGSFASKLDENLSLFDVKLDNAAHVFITRCRPNFQEPPRVLPLPKKQDAGACKDKTNFQTQITANFHKGTSRMSNLTGRVELISDDLTTKLRNGAAVDTTQTSPCVITVKIGTGSSQPQLCFPVPVLKSQNKVRIARKSSYIEVIVPIASPSMKHYFPSFMHPIFPGYGSPITWNAPYLPMPQLPVIDTTRPHKSAWLRTHLTASWSARERRVRDASLHSPTGHDPEARIAFKDSICSIISHFADRTSNDTSPTPFFALNNAAAGGVHIILLASALRLDLASQSIVLDAACIPLTYEIIEAIAPALQELHSHPRYPLCQVHVDGAELGAWKAALPAMAERARTWAHGAGAKCAYNKQNNKNKHHSERPRAPPVSFADGEPVLCACGAGIFPDGFGDAWGLEERAAAALARVAVRVAVAPIFSSWMAEAQQAVPSFSGRMMEKGEEKKQQDSLGGSHSGGGGGGGRGGGDDGDTGVAISAEAGGRGSSGRGTGGGVVTMDGAHALPPPPPPSGGNGCACAACGRTERSSEGGGGGGGGELLRCSRCKVVRYCSPECQRRDWKAHKVGCRAPVLSTTG